MEKSGPRTGAKPLGSPIFLKTALFLLKKHEIAAFVLVDKSGYFYGCGGRIRTNDLRVMSPTSYQLLYTAICLLLASLNNISRSRALVKRKV